MAEKTLEIGIIGLGKFGLRMATTLASMGHTVIGIDMSDARVQLAEACPPARTCPSARLSALR